MDGQRIAPTGEVPEILPEVSAKTAVCTELCISDLRFCVHWVVRVQSIVFDGFFPIDRGMNMVVQNTGLLGNGCLVRLC